MTSTPDADPPTDTPAAPATGDAEGETLPQLVALLSDIRALPSTDRPHSDTTTVRIGDDDASVVLNRSGTDITLRTGERGSIDTLRTLLEELANIGAVARDAVAAIGAHDQELRAAAKTSRREDAAASATTAGPGWFGFTPGAVTTTGSPDRWLLDGHMRIDVRRGPFTTPAWSSAAPTVAELDVVDGDTIVATIALDADMVATTDGRHRYLRLPDDIVGRERYRELARANPWSDYRAPGKGSTAADHVMAVVAYAEAAGAWVRAVDDVTAFVERVRAEREEVRKAWARKSRSKERIATAKLNSWCEAVSHVSYASNGLVLDGWRAAPKGIVAETRPRYLDPVGHGRGRTPGVGVAELLYVAKIVHVDARNANRQVEHLRFYDTDVAKLREALPDCVIKVPEGGGAVFVAFDKPEYVEALDAAMVEWILTNP